MNPIKHLSQTTITLSACRSLSGEFTKIVNQVADDMNVPERDLTIRSLAQIPRITNANDEVLLVDLKKEIIYTATELRENMLAFEAGGGEWPVKVDRVSQLVFGTLDSRRAKTIISNLHYLRSYRNDSSAYALFHPETGQPIAVCTVSPLQWKNLVELIQKRMGIPPSAVMDVSRVFVFSGAPKNCISTLLGRLRIHLRKNHPEIKLLSTAVDQNLAFRGSSYRGSNWQLLCTVQPRPYLYFDSAYMTIRQSREIFGEKQWAEIAKSTKGRFEISKAPLLDSLIFIQYIKNDPKNLFNKVYQLERQGI